MTHHTIPYHAIPGSVLVSVLQDSLHYQAGSGQSYLLPTADCLHRSVVLGTLYCGTVTISNHSYPTASVVILPLVPVTLFIYTNLG